MNSPRRFRRVRSPADRVRCGIPRVSPRSPTRHAPACRCTGRSAGPALRLTRTAPAPTGPAAAYSGLRRGLDRVEKRQWRRRWRRRGSRAIVTSARFLDLPQRPAGCQRASRGDMADIGALIDEEAQLRDASPSGRKGPRPSRGWRAPAIVTGWALRAALTSVGTSEELETGDLAPRPRDAGRMSAAPPNQERQMAQCPDPPTDMPRARPDGRVLPGSVGARIVGDHRVATRAPAGCTGNSARVSSPGRRFRTGAAMGTVNQSRSRGISDTSTTTGGSHSPR
jgi:hypothetical protein